MGRAISVRHLVKEDHEDGEGTELTGMLHAFEIIIYLALALTFNRIIVYVTTDLPSAKRALKLRPRALRGSRIRHLHASPRLAASRNVSTRPPRKHFIRLSSSFVTFLMQ